MLVGRKISIILLVIFLGVFAWYFATNLDDFGMLLHVSFLLVLVVIIGHVISIVTNGLFVKEIMEANGKHLSYHKSFVASAISAIGNFFFPAGVGTAAQAKYLKSEHGFNYKSFLSAMSGNYIIVFLVNGFLGLCAMAALWSKSDNPVYYVLVVVFFGMLLPNLYLALKGIPNRLVRKLELSGSGVTSKIGALMADVMKGWNFITSHRVTLYKLIGITVINFMASLLISFASIHAVGLTIGFWPLVLYGALGAVTFIINVTPGSVGIREGVYVFTTSIIGLSAPQILAVALIDRLCRFIVLILGFGMFYSYIKKSNSK